MKKFAAYLFLNLLSFVAVAQVGIGTVNPDSASILDVFSNNKGVLFPRITTSDRDNIVNPPEGLLLFNSTSKSINYFDTTWKDMSANYKSINSVNPISTISTVAVVIPGLDLQLSKGAYAVSFDAQITNISSSPPSNIVNSDLLLTDFSALYNQLHTYAVTYASHTADFGNDETITSGKYRVPMAISVAGVLELDGQGDPNAIFIINANGAINFGAGSSIVLSNGASSENIFWLAEGAVGVGANSTVSGALVSHGAAVAVGASCNIMGSMYTNVGAIAFGPGVCTVSANPSSIINLGSLETFVVYTGAGAINNTGSSTYNGNVCSGAGDISSLNAATVNGIKMPPSVDTELSQITLPLSFIATFSLFQNNVLIPSSRKKVTCNSGFTSISLQGIATVLEGETVTVKWETDSEKLTLGNRVLTSIKVQ